MLQVNPEEVVSLWTSQSSVSRRIMSLYNYLQSEVVEFSDTPSKTYISFHEWTMLGGKRGN